MPFLHRYRVYNFPNSLSVYDRLTADATVRQNLRSMRLPAAKPPALDVALSFPNTLLTRATGKLSSSNNVLHQPVAGRPSGYVKEIQPCSWLKYHGRCTVLHDCLHLLHDPGLKTFEGFLG